NGSNTNKNNSSDISSVSSEQNLSEPDDSSSQEDTPSEPEVFVTPTGVELDADFGRLLLINGENALPDDYDTKVREYLVEIDPQYRNNNYVTQIHKDVYPYITAMVAAAQADGVDLRVWSPFRSYAIQNDLFQKQVNRVGGDEEKAATVVARPGTSEHNTGLCADFNMASDTFESTPMYTWMCENAENYGFILRYPKDKQHITGVIYESWHWRFVGINNAKLINELGLTLEEFIEMKNFDPAMDMYGDDSASNTAEQIID
ncbi:MAG: M15 family metallopeptidase, partial [Clostridia bacterium]|nr:M15 family metallopeptidase [Clostridia bacterium]